MKSVVPIERIEKSIVQVRSQRVMMDSTLAELYQVETKNLLQAVRRNIERFPDDFMFQLNREEADALRSQTVTLKRGQHRKYLPFAFTEQGVAMLSSVLRSQRAIQVNIEIMRTFVQMKRMLTSYEDLALKVDALEKKYDVQFSAVFDAIRQLMTPPDPKKKQIGFHWDEHTAKSGKQSPAKTGRKFAAKTGRKSPVPG